VKPGNLDKSGAFSPPPPKESPLLHISLSLTYTVLPYLTYLNFSVCKLYTGLTDILDFEGTAWFRMTGVCACVWCVGV
jgi:hypothetical protein